MPSKTLTTEQAAAAFATYDGLRAVTLADARAELDELDAVCHLFPAGRAQFHRDWIGIQEACATLKITHVDAMIARHVAVLTAATGIKDPAGYHSTEEQNRLHRLRNVMLTVAVAAVANRQPATVLAFTRDTLHQRSDKSIRPFVDDEIVLLRAIVAVSELAEPGQKRTMVYALCEAGMTTTDTPHVHAAHRAFSDKGPGLAVATATKRTPERILELDDFQRRALPIPAAGKSVANGPLTYSSNKRAGSPSQSAASSANAMLRRLIELAGLLRPDTSVRSLTCWRIASAWSASTNGPTAAMLISGKNEFVTRRLAGEPVAHKHSDKTSKALMQQLAAIA